MKILKQATEHWQQKQLLNYINNSLIYKEDSELILIFHWIGNPSSKQNQTSKIIFDEVQKWTIALKLWANTDGVAHHNHGCGGSGL